MRTLAYTVPQDWDGRALRDFARKRLGFSARLLAQQKKLPGGVLVNGAPCPVSAVLCAGDTVAFPLPAEAAPAIPPAGRLSVRWETEDLLAADKPAGMPVYPCPGHDRDSLLNAVAAHYLETGQSGRLRPLYRLDRDTSGLLVLAKHLAAAGTALEKRYFALCQGELSGAGTINRPIGLAPGSRIQRRCGTGERAVTHWRALAYRDGCTLLALSLETGRTHQIRVHLADLGYPLAGDDLYGGSRERAPRQALHCGWVRAVCPALDLDQTLTVDFPPDLRAAFPWLPAVGDLIKEIALCQPV